MNFLRAGVCFFLLILIGCPGLVSRTQYFPTSFCCGPEDDFHYQLYAVPLSRMKEPSLLGPQGEEGSDVYRFLWLPSFREPVAIRLTIQPDGSGQLETKILNGAGGYDPGKLAIHSKKKVKKEDLVSFNVAAKNASRWFLEEELPPTRQGFDGAEWIFEASIDGNYYVLKRSSPKPNNGESPAAQIENDFYRLGTALMDLSQTKFDPVY